MKKFLLILLIALAPVAAFSNESQAVVKTEKNQRPDLNSDVADILSEKTAAPEIKLKNGKKLSEKSKKNKVEVASPQVDEAKIEPFNFEKLFSEAEKYFKAAKAWNKLKCEPKTGFICTKWECVKRDVKSTITLDKKAETITRCDVNECETFEAEFKQTGAFFNVQSEGPVGTLIRVLGDSRYKEVSTVGLDAYIANGNCEVIE